MSSAKLVCGCANIRSDVTESLRYTDCKRGFDVYLEDSEWNRFRFKFMNFRWKIVSFFLTGLEKIHSNSIQCIDSLKFTLSSRFDIK